MADVNISKFRAQVVREGSKPAAPGFVVSEGQDPVNPPGTNNFVPYTGATANVELGEFGLETGFVNLDTTPTNIPTEQGGIYWDDTRSTAALIMNGVLQHIGQDVFYYVKNSTGSSIAKGTAVRFDGTDGASGHLKIAPFLANGTYPSNYFVGVTAETIANGAFGQVMHFGELDGINTSGYTAGALLYASTTVAGGFQTTAPVAPNNIVLIAAAINSKNNGTILVRPTYGSNINQDEGVKITSGTTGDLLQLQAGGLWENKTVSQVIGSAYVPSTRTITINGTTQDLSANRTYNVGTVTSVGLSSATSGVTIGSTPVTGSGTITIAIATATSTQNGLLSSTDWSTFNSKQNALTLTTTGTSGAATLVGSTLNIPIYSPDLSGYVPSTRTITINGTAFDLSANRSWSVGTVTSVAALTLGTSGTDLNSTVANGTTTPVITLNVPTASATNRGALSAADWSTFNSKQNALTNPVTGTGTTNYLAKFTGSTTVGNSQVFDNGTYVGIGTSGASVGNDFVSIFFNSSTARSQAINIKDTNASANGSTFEVYRKSDDTYLGNIRRNGTDDAIFVGGNSYLALGSGNTERMRITSGGNVLIGTTTDVGAKLYVNGGIRTANPTGSTSNDWLLGRALTSGTSSPDRWIRVQIGNLYYDILAVYMGSV
jgi:predicted heme/steroid binding protein